MKTEWFDRTINALQLNGREVIGVDTECHP